MRVMGSINWHIDQCISRYVGCYSIVSTLNQYIRQLLTKGQSTANQYTIKHSLISANISTVISSVAYWSTFVQLPVVHRSTVGPVSGDRQTKKEKLQWIFKQWSSGLQWNSAKVLHWRENRERPSITPNALTGVRVAIHHHLTWH